MVHQAGCLNPSAWCEDHRHVYLGWQWGISVTVSTPCKGRAGPLHAAFPP